MSAPIDRPTTTTGGSHTAWISSAVSPAISAIVHGSGWMHAAGAMPRLVKIVLRNALRKSGTW